MAVCKGQKDKARRRLQDAARIHRESRETMLMAEAECARLALLELADSYPKLKGFSFYVSSEYNDEGYEDYLNISVHPYELEEDDYELSDALYSLRDWGQEAVAVLCGQESYAQEGSCTVADARKRRF